MTKVIGLTGGIASGKTTIINFLKKIKIPTHESDKEVKKLYKNPSKEFLSILKKIGLKKTIDGERINKRKIREEVFASVKKRKSLEKFIHKKIKITRDKFLKNQKLKKSKIVFLDIPLLFEKKLEKICDYTVLLCAKEKIRRNRAIKRKGMNKKILDGIINSQLKDSVKRKKANFVINSNKSKKKCFDEIKKIINLINRDL